MMGEAPTPTSTFTLKILKRNYANQVFKHSASHCPVSRNLQLPTSVASLAYDRLARSGPLLSLYHSDHFVR